jgi:hypothetical protein
MKPSLGDAFYLRYSQFVTCLYVKVIGQSKFMLIAVLVEIGQERKG